MRSADDIRERLKTANQSAVGRAIGLDAYKINNIAHKRREIEYDEGRAMLPILFPEDFDSRAISSEERRAEASASEAHRIAVGLLAAVLRRAKIDAVVQDLVVELFAASLRAALSLPQGDPSGDPDRLADIFWRARPPQ